MNISVVDEALFALMDYSVDTLEMLYWNVSDYLRFSIASHRTFKSNPSDNREMLGRATIRNPFGPLADSDGFTMPPAADGTFEEFGAGGSRDERIRERFEDTANFISVRTKVCKTSH